MKSWALTDPGCVRTQNQDAHIIRQLDRGSLLCVVCDGMGGAKSGNIASALAAEVFAQEVQRLYTGGMDMEAVDQVLERAVKLANFTVYDRSQQFEEFQGMGTTLVAALIQGRKVTVVNVGDSRAYVVGAYDIHQVTVDHSLVQMMIARGQIHPDRAREMPGKNYITRAIGTEPTVQSDLFHLVMDRGDLLLLCSDGLTNLVDDQEILFEVLHGVSRKSCCQRLVDIAKSRGAPDNVTCLLVQG